MSRQRNKHSTASMLCTPPVRSVRTTSTEGASFSPAPRYISELRMFTTRAGSITEHPRFGVVIRTAPAGRFAPCASSGQERRGMSSCRPPSTKNSVLQNACRSPPWVYPRAGVTTKAGNVMSVFDSDIRNERREALRNLSAACLCVLSLILLLPLLHRAARLDTISEYPGSSVPRI